MFVAGHTMGTPEMTPEEAFAFFAGIGCAGTELVCQEGYRCGVTPALYAQGRRGGRGGGGGPRRPPRGRPVDEPPRRAQPGGCLAATRLAADRGAGVVRAYGGKEVPAADRPRA